MWGDNDVRARLKVTKLKHECLKFVNRICHIRCPCNAWLFLFARSFAADVIRNTWVLTSAAISHSARLSGSSKSRGAQ
jgi:hypothetical protein